jgi:hypothetical protein
MSFFAGKTKSTLGASSGRGGKAPKNGKNGIFSFPGKTTPIAALPKRGDMGLKIAHFSDLPERAG